MVCEAPRSGSRCRYQSQRHIFIIECWSHRALIRVLGDGFSKFTAARILTTSPHLGRHEQRRWWAVEDKVRLCLCLSGIRALLASSYSLLRGTPLAWSRKHRLRRHERQLARVINKCELQTTMCPAPFPIQSIFKEHSANLELDNAICQLFQIPGPGG